MLQKLKELFLDALAGFALSGGVSLIWTEAIHIMAVVVGGVLSTVAIFFTTRWLNKKFPK